MHGSEVAVGWETTPPTTPGLLLRDDSFSATHEHGGQTDLT